MINLKSKAEIQSIGHASHIVAEILQELESRVKPGLTTGQIEGFAKELIASYDGASLAFKGYKGFPGHICTSINEQIVHGIPGSQKLKEGDIISLDVGVELNGYYGDAAITVGVGRIAQQLQKLIDVTRESLDLCIEKAIAGNRIGDISSAVQHHVEENKFSVVREYVGHGVGLKVHEEPPIPNFGKPSTGPRLKPGMVLAIEPMVNLGTYRARVLSDGWTVVTQDGKPSAHFEHTVAVTEGKPKVLTKRKA